MRRTRDPRVWAQYACWCVQFWMRRHVPSLPGFVRRWALRHFGNDRFNVTPQMFAWWSRRGMVTNETPRPIPWPIGEAALGPFVRPWGRVADFIRRGTGGRSHRCEFTDPKRGALYGHKDGAFVDAYFDALVANIERDEVIDEVLETSPTRRH